jgi:hypothetical protein
MGTITIMSALGGFSGPWAYKGSQASEGYPDGQIATLSLFCASILAYIILWYATDVPFIFPRLFKLLNALLGRWIPFKLLSNQFLIFSRY